MMRAQRLYVLLCRHAGDFADMLRIMHVQRCAMSVALSKRSVEQAQSELAKAFDAHDRAVAEYRLHQGEVAQHEIVRRNITPIEKGFLTWEIEAPKASSRAPRSRAVLKPVP